VKDYLASQVQAASSPVEGRNAAREYLQARLLGALQRAGALIPLAFHGGTALRFLYATQRYSEDLDFALEGSRERYDFRAYLRAILQRPYLKGRDLYDLLWYISAPDWPAPNLTLLNNALTQTGWSDPALQETSWRAAVAARLRGADWPQAAADVRPFLEPGADAGLLTWDNLAQVLRIDD
jgi:hypothetical protein